MEARIRTRWALAALILTAVAGCSSGTEPTVHEVRGVYVGPAYGGVAFIVDHERIPGYMDAMRMTLKLRDPAALEGVAPGDKIRFELVITEEDVYVDALEVLPDGTELQLVGEPGPVRPDST